MTVKRLWVPLLVALLVAGLIGPGITAGADPKATVTRSIMIPASEFTPTTGNWDFSNNGYYLWMTSGAGNFAAPLSFPVPVVNIKKITLYAYDNSISYDICVTPHRARPTDGAMDLTADGLCTEEATTDPQYASTTSISPRQVNSAGQGAYLWVHIDGPNVKFYGVKVNYSYEI